VSRHRDNIRNAGLMCVSMAGFSANDAIFKLVGTEFGLAQTVFMRGTILCLLFGTYAWFRGTFRTMPGRRDRAVIAVRTVAEIGITACFLSAVLNMPIANATAILQFVPLAIVVAAHFVFGTRAGPMRFAAIFVGLVGVLIIIRPGTAGFNAYSLLALLAVLFVVLRDLASRKLSSSADSLFVTLASALMVTMVFGLATLVDARWTPPSRTDFGLLSLSAVFLFAGYYFGVVTMRTGDIFFVSPFRYSIMIFSAIFGALLFAEIPDALTVLGILILVGAGVFTIRREKAALEG
ncbi:MAG: DMT family transporter, partial [Rhodobacteraceae bacterium]|nr:DMT family transporter [Paracoccaceae bacterium]